ncbi:hypothetical protein [Rickettsia endosymbiont of Gonocerus acuteangulatus]|uniref:hypothetical protein n=1 Tax=Rickettsia endosymbiont of Gonocerus acuteangulatus TaxID=3066266 RepID=UPI0031334AF0
MMEVASKEELAKIAKEIARVLKNDGIFIMLVCNENTYNRDRSMLDQANFKILNIHKPLGTDQDGYNWINEKIISPFSIFIAQKI